MNSTAHCIGTPVDFNGRKGCGFGEGAGAGASAGAGVAVAARLSEKQTDHEKQHN